MNWNIRKITSSVKRQLINKNLTNNIKSEEFIINHDDLQKLNEPILNYVCSLTKEDINRRLKEISVENILSDSNMEKTQEVLKANGIVVIPKFVDEKIIDNIENQISLIIKKYDEQIKGTKHFEDEHLVVNVENKIKGYSNIANYNKPIISVRQGQDRGMLDVFNVERLIDDFCKEQLTSIYKDKRLVKLLNLGKGITLSNINIYINNQITKTRGFHIDQFNQDYKGFIYLTDVLDMKDGPYCYVKGTNKADIWRSANTEISKLCPNKTESPLVDLEKIIPILAPKGSLVVSDQSGVHRGIPQSPNGHRKVLVARYK